MDQAVIVSGEWACIWRRCSVSAAEARKGRVFKMNGVKKNFAEVDTGYGKMSLIGNQIECNFDSFRSAFTVGVWVTVPVISYHTSRKKMYGKIIAATEQLFVVQSAVLEGIRESYSWADVFMDPDSFCIITGDEAVKKERTLVSGMRAFGAA
jgi:hypothetical protein